MEKLLIEFSIIFVSILTLIYRWSIFAYIIISWIPSSSPKFRGILARIVEPVMKPFSWAKIGNLSFAAIIAFIAIDYLGALIVRELSQLL